MGLYVVVESAVLRPVRMWHQTWAVSTRGNDFYGAQAHLQQAPGCNTSGQNAHVHKEVGGRCSQSASQGKFRQAWYSAVGTTSTDSAALRQGTVTQMLHETACPSTCPA